MPQRLPNFQFERGLHLRIVQHPEDDARSRVLDEYLVIGRLEDGVPFLLQYSRVGVTSWSCPSRLGEPLRRKILGRLRTEIRYAKASPAYLTVLDFAQDASRGDPAEAVERFHRETWKAETLGEREGEYVDLEVPYAEKDAAKRLGAHWDPARCTWKVRTQKDMRPFSRWLPSTAR